MVELVCNVSAADSITLSKHAICFGFGIVVSTYDVGHNAMDATSCSSCDIFNISWFWSSGACHHFAFLVPLGHFSNCRKCRCQEYLYQQGILVQQVQLIVYDEIHYLRDKERGVVWEESIIMAPKTARFVFLSATIPNAREFAEWIAKTHRSPCHVVYTDYRPTPLQHYLFPSGAQGLYMVVDEKGWALHNILDKASGLRV